MAKQGVTKKPRTKKPASPAESVAPDLRSPIPTQPDAPTPAELIRKSQEEFERRQLQAIAKAAITFDEVDKAILQLKIQHPGITQKTIAEVLGYTRQQINVRINAAKFKRALDEIAMTAIQVFESNQARAARKLGLLIDSVDETVAIRASIAHLWPIIHRDPAATTGQDFVKFVNEAFELAQANRGKLKPAGGGTGSGSSGPGSALPDIDVPAVST